MPLALVSMSHSPLLELSQPPAELAADVETAFEAARTFIKEYDPELVVVFGPDHYNGFFYELMPQFCIGLAATSIGAPSPDLKVVRMSRRGSGTLPTSRSKAPLAAGPESRTTATPAGSRPLDSAKIDSLLSIAGFIAQT